MGAAGFWDDAERAASVSAGARAHVAAPGGLPDAAEPTWRTSTGWPRWRLRTRRCRRRSTSRSHRSRSGSPSSRSSGCSPAPTTPATRSSPSTPGAGGTDAQDWAEMVLRMLMRWAEARGFAGRAARGQPGRGSGHQVGDVPGLGRERLRAVRRRARRAPARAPLAVRLRPPPPDELRGRRGRPGRRRDSGEVEINDDDLQVDTYRASGAGGQHVNKTDSAVRITHRPTGIVVQCQNERSQSSNRATAMAMLTAKLLERKERERQEEIAREKGEAQDVNFGSQIRSYVLHPYTMVKDHRTGSRDGRRAARAGRRSRRVRARLSALGGAATPSAG